MEGKKKRRGRERTCLSVFPTDRQNIPHHVAKFSSIPLPAVKSRFLWKFLHFPHSSLYFGQITDTKNTLPDPDARLRCKASENTQGTSCIALFFAVISVHWQHELVQSLLLSCPYVTSVQLRQYSCMWAEEICRGRRASHLRLTREAIENTRGHFGASSCAHTQSASHAYRIF